MKTIKIALIGLGALMLGSCTVSHTAIVTNNPVGTKVGMVKAKSTQTNADYSFNAAMKNGGITKVGIAETKVTMFFIAKGTTVVTGE